MRFKVSAPFSFDPAALLPIIDNGIDHHAILKTASGARLQSSGLAFLTLHMHSYRAA